MVVFAFRASDLCLGGRRWWRRQALAGALLCCCVLVCVMPEADAKGGKRRSKKKGPADASPVATTGASDAAAGDGTCDGGRCEKLGSDSAQKGAYQSLERQWDEYKALHARMLRLAADPSTRSQARFVVFRVCCGELGNRLLGLTSTLLYALASHRALLIEWPEIEGFRCARCWSSCPV